jgi:hypothetical protein
MTASVVIFGGKEDSSTYAHAEAVKRDAYLEPPLPAQGSVTVQNTKTQSQNPPPPPPPSPPILTDTRCTLKENDYHDPLLLSFQQECVQAASSTKVGHNLYKMRDNVAELPADLASPLEDIPYTPQQKHSLRSLLTSTYARSKYLMHSSGSGQVSLLQGKRGGQGC